MKSPAPRIFVSCVASLCVALAWACTGPGGPEAPPSGVPLVHPVTGEPLPQVVAEADEIAAAAQRHAAIEAALADAKQLDPVQTHTLHALRVFADLAAVVHRPQLPWQVHLIERPELGAFAAGGGYIYLYDGVFGDKGLVSEGDDDELAALLAHLMAHTALLHTSLEPAATHDTQEARRDPFHGGSFTAEQEEEADRLATLYMALSGYNPRAAWRVWGRAVRNFSSRELPAFLSEHPLSLERADRVATAASETARYYTAGQQHPDWLKLRDDNPLFPHRLGPPRSVPATAAASPAPSAPVAPATPAPQSAASPAMRSTEPAPAPVPAPAAPSVRSAPPAAPVAPPVRTAQPPAPPTPAAPPSVPPVSPSGAAPAPVRTAQPSPQPLSPSGAPPTPAPVRTAQPAPSPRTIPSAAPTPVAPPSPAPARSAQPAPSPAAPPLRSAQASSPAPTAKPAGHEAPIPAGGAPARSASAPAPVASAAPAGEPQPPVDARPVAFNTELRSAPDLDAEGRDARIRDGRFAQGLKTALDEKDRRENPDRPQPPLRAARPPQPGLAPALVTFQDVRYEYLGAGQAVLKLKVRNDAERPVASLGFRIAYFGGTEPLLEGTCRGSADLPAGQSGWLLCDRQFTPGATEYEVQITDVQLR